MDMWLDSEQTCGVESFLGSYRQGPIILSFFYIDDDSFHGCADTTFG